MGFRLVPKSVTLNDLERRNGRVVRVISLNSVAVAAYYVKVVKIHRGKLVLITNRKSYIGFRLVPKSVTLNDREWRNGHYFAKFGTFRGQVVN